MTRTHLLLMGARVGDTPPCVEEEDVRLALPPETEVASVCQVRLDQASLVEESAWPAALEQLTQQVRRWQRKTLEAGPGPIHVSIFAKAPIPLLMALGRLVGEHHSASLYQLHRSPRSWCWPDPASYPPLSYHRTDPAGRVRGRHAVALLSVSGRVDRSAALEAAQTSGAEGDVGVWELVVPSPRLDLIKRPEDIDTFAAAWRGLVSKVHDELGMDGHLHVFPALPIPLAIEVGRRYLPGADPTLHLYEVVRSGAPTGFVRRLRFSQEQITFAPAGSGGGHSPTTPLPSELNNPNAPCPGESVMKLPPDLRKHLRKAIAQASGPSSAWLREMWVQAGLDVTRIHWEQPTERVASDVLDEVSKQPRRLGVLIQEMVETEQGADLLGPLLPEVRAWVGSGVGPPVGAPRPADPQGQRPFTVLLLSALPLEASPLAVDAELRDIKQVLRGTRLANQITLEQGGATRWEDLRTEMLRTRPRWVLLSGHGLGEEGWMAEGDGDQGEPVAPHTLQQLFSAFGDTTELVVFSACSTEKCARALAGVIPNAIGMSRAISDRAAPTFSKVLFQALFEGHTVADAFKVAKAELMQNHPREAEIPVLLARAAGESPDQGAPQGGAAAGSPIKAQA